MPATNPSTLLFGETDGASGVLPKSEPRMWAKVSPRNVPHEHGQDQHAAVLELSQEHSVRQRGADPDEAERAGKDGLRPVARRGSPRNEPIAKTPNAAMSAGASASGPSIAAAAMMPAVSAPVASASALRVAQEPHALERRERGDERHERRPRRAADPQERRDHRGAGDRDGQPAGQVAQAPAPRCPLLGNAHLRTLADG